MKILINDQIDPTVWNDIVKNNIYHRFEWLKIIKDVYGLEPFYIMVYEDKRFALLPSFKIKNKLVSMPFLYIVGYLSNCDDLLTELQSFIKSKSLEVQYKYITQETKESSTLTAIININEKELFWKSLSSNMRNQIRKSQKNKFKVKRESSVDNFYDIYSKKMHILGTPVHSKDFFKKIIDSFTDAYIFTVFLDELPLGSLFCMSTNDFIDRNKKTLCLMSAATKSEYDRYYPNYFLYFEVINLFIEKGVNSIDLGTCKIDSPQYLFKKKWRPEFYTVAQKNGKQDYKDNKKLVIMSQIWKKMPFPVANYLGPKFRKYLY